MATVTTSWPTGPRQRLPHIVAPFRTETVCSYLTRLAHANHLPSSCLQSHIAGGATRRARADWLAAATGIAENILRERLIGFGAANGTNTKQKAKVRPACRLCMARRGVYEPVYCWLPAHQTVCFRHTRWIGPSADSWEKQHDLRTRPDVLAAARRHRQLIRRHRDLAGNALSEARHILTWWSRVDQKDASSPSGGKMAPIVHLETYPDLIAVAAVLADHRHQVMATTHPRYRSWSDHLLDLINAHTTSYRHDPRPLQYWIDDQRIIGRISYCGAPPRHYRASCR